MATGKLGILVALVLVSLLGSVSVANATSVPGMGHYCSGTWSNGGWAFTAGRRGQHALRRPGAHLALARGQRLEVAQQGGRMLGWAVAGHQRPILGLAASQ